MAELNLVDKIKALQTRLSQIDTDINNTNAQLANYREQYNTSVLNKNENQRIADDYRQQFQKDTDRYNQIGQRVSQQNGTGWMDEATRRFYENWTRSGTNSPVYQYQSKISEYQSKADENSKNAENYANAISQSNTKINQLNTTKASVQTSLNDLQGQRSAQESGAAFGQMETGSAEQFTPIGTGENLGTFEQNIGLFTGRKQEYQQKSQQQIQSIDNQIKALQAKLATTTEEDLKAPLQTEIARLQQSKQQYETQYGLSTNPELQARNIRNQRERYIQSLRRQRTEQMIKKNNPLAGM